jgi:hypothetical protein
MPAVAVASAPLPIDRTSYGTPSVPDQASALSPDTLVPSTTAEPPTETPYAEGIAAWSALRIWVTGATGDRRAGIDYWAANRHVHGHLTCATKAAEYSSDPHARAAFTEGCLQAKQRLEPIDARRKEDADYRSGFKDESKRSPM